MALEAGANSFLSKPVSSQELTDRVAAVLQAGVDYRVHTGLLTEPVPRAHVRTGCRAAPARNTAAQHRRGYLSRVACLRDQTHSAPQNRPRCPSAPKTLNQPADIAPTRLPVITMLSLRGGSRLYHDRRQYGLSAVGYGAARLRRRTQPGGRAHPDAYSPDAQTTLGAAARSGGYTRSAPAASDLAPTHGVGRDGVGRAARCHHRTR